jgi:hypothetical protein
MENDYPACADSALTPNVVPWLQNRLLSSVFPGPAMIPLGIDD